VGADLVNHCVNDIACRGDTAFLPGLPGDGKLDEDVVESVVSGLADACKANACVLIGGETAQMPGSTPTASTTWRDLLWRGGPRQDGDGAGIKPGDVLIGLPSTGLHTNGYSLRASCCSSAGTRPRNTLRRSRRRRASLLRTHRSYLHVIQKLVTAG